MVVFIFSVSDKNGKKRFFDVKFPLADLIPDIFFRISFLTMSNVNVDFQARDLQ